MNPAILFTALFVLFGTIGRIYAQSLPVLSLPIDCKLGYDCVIQNYVDRDPSPTSLDYKCGSRTYDDHNGTDFRIPDNLAREKGVAVLAAADGTVDRLRDGEPDISVRVLGQTSVANKECGNAVVISHDAGWTTQYCHMAKGSIIVKPGQKVVAGDILGAVGLSGNTEYPHVHFSIRQNGKIIDPFSYGTAGACDNGGKYLWNDDIKVALQYHDIEVLNKGFSSIPVTMENIESGDVLSHPLTREGSLVVFVRVVGLKAGDVQSLVVTSPDGNVFLNQSFPPSDADKAQAYVSIGRRNPTSAWLNGEYRAAYSVRRGNSQVFQTSFTATR